MTAPLTQQDREDLLAYLDGELSPGAVAELERRLAREPALCEHLQLLQKTWDALEILEPPQASQTLTIATLELTARKVQEPAGTDGLSLPAWTGRGWAVRLALMLVSGFMAYVAVRYYAGAENRWLREHADILRDFTVHQTTINLDFLRQLDQADLLDIPPETSHNVATLEEPGFSWDAASAEMQTELRKQVEQFRRLSHQQQQHIRSLHEMLKTDPEGGRLRRVLTAYEEWIDALAVGDRNRLFALPLSQRLQRIEQLQQLQKQQDFEHYLRGPLGREDARHLFSWLEDFVESHQEELLRHAMPRVRANFRSALPQVKRQVLLRLYQRNSQDILPTPDDIESLMSGLSTIAQAQVNNATTFDEKRRLVRESIRIAALVRNAKRGPVPAEELQAFYRDELTPAQRETIDLLPPDLFRAELLRRYAD